VKDSDLFESGICSQRGRLAIRAARLLFRLPAYFAEAGWRDSHQCGSKNEGTIREQVNFSPFLFRTLDSWAFLVSLRKYRSYAGSIPTAPTNHLPDWSGLKKFTRGQKGEDKAIDPVLMSIFSGTGDNRIREHFIMALKISSWAIAKSV
jgi:hypothetical protein